MNQKSLTILVGFVLLSSLAMGGFVYAQSTSFVTHQTGDILIYDMEGGNVEESSSYFEVYDYDRSLVSYQNEGFQGFWADVEGETVVGVVEFSDLKHIPPEFDPTNQPDFPNDVDVFGLQIQTEAESTGNFEFDNREYKYDEVNGTFDGWYNKTDTGDFGPEHFRDVEQQGALGRDGFALLPIGDNDDLNLADIIDAENFTTTEEVGFNLGDNWINMEVEFTFGFFHEFGLQDDAGLFYDLYGVEASAEGTLTNYFMSVPLGPRDDPSTPWIEVNVTLDVYVESWAEYYFGRDVDTNGLFLGFYEDESSSVIGIMENENTTIYYPHDGPEPLSLDNHNSNVSIYSDFDIYQYRYQDISLVDYLGPFESQGTNPGLQEGDELHYKADESTLIEFTNTGIVDDGPDGPDLDNPTYETQSFLGSVDADMDMWLNVYIHNSDKVGFVMERLYSNLEVTGFPDGSDDKLSIDQEGDGPDIIYTFELSPLVHDNPDTGIESTADKDLVLPVDTSAEIGMSPLFRMGDDDGGDNGGNDGGPLGFIFDIARDLHLDLRAPLTSDTTESSTRQITVNGFDYSVDALEERYVYEIIFEGNVPFTFDDDRDDGPEEGTLGIDQGEDHGPPATLYYQIVLTITDVRTYDTDTGALIEKIDQTDLFVNTSIVADLSEMRPDIGSILAFETTYVYEFETVYLLVDHPNDYQSEQVIDSTSSSDNPDTTATTDDANNTDVDESPQLDLPGFGFVSAILGTGFMVAYYRRRQ